MIQIQIIPLAWVLNRTEGCMLPNMFCIKGNTKVAIPILRSDIATFPQVKLNTLCVLCALSAVRNDIQNYINRTQVEVNTAHPLLTNISLLLLWEFIAKPRKEASTKHHLRTSTGSESAEYDNVFLAFLLITKL